MALSNKLILDKQIGTQSVYGLEPLDNPYGP